MIPEAALEDLRRRNPVDQVAEKLGAQLRRVGRSLMGSCPICSDDLKSRSATRFEVKPGREKWVCAVCEDGGDVIRLVERARGLDFRAAVAWLGGVREISPEERARADADRERRRLAREAEAERYRAAELMRIKAIWQAARPARGTLVEAYLAARRLALPETTLLRFAPQLDYFHGNATDERGRSRPRRVHCGPAMLAKIVGPDGKGAALHQTYLAADGSGKATIADPETGEILPAKKVRGSKKAGYIPLINPPEPRILLYGEGIETVLSAVEIPLGERRGRAAFWAAVDLGNLGGKARESVPHPTDRHANGHAVRVPGPVPDLSDPVAPIPDSVAELVLVKDGDSEPVLTEYALERASARYDRPGRTISILEPGARDLNDLLRKERGA